MSRRTPGWIVAVCLALGVAQAAETQVLTIVIHGGAGVIAREQLGPDGGAAYREGLNAALDAGYSVLEAGGSSLDAVTAAVRLLEDNPLFNAGRGAVLNHEGEAELDASIMDGRDLRAGAIAGVKHVRNPIDLARRVMEHSPHVLLHGAGAEEFALQQGYTLVPNDYFRTPARKAQLERILRGQTQPKNELVALHRRGSGGRPARQRRSGDFNRRYGRQTLVAHRRLADHRCRHLRRQRKLCRVGDRPR